MDRRVVSLAAVFASMVLVGGNASLRSAPGPRPPEHGKVVRRLLIDNATVIYGSGKPPFGPVDLLVEDGRIARVALDGSIVDADAVIDATGKYVLPGLVDTHMHWHDERGGVPQPVQYERNLYLAAGVTTTRELGGDFIKSKRWQSEAARQVAPSPRMLVYWVVTNVDTVTADTLRASVREAKERGADGLKVFGMDRDQLRAVMAEAHLQGLRTAAHIGVEETTAKDFIELGVDSIEHFYGVADAALDGSQRFPPHMNYSDEALRFGHAGELYAQANPAKLARLVDLMVEKHVAWSPTLSIYEANRDLTRARSQPWFHELLHPALEAFFAPNPDHHGSYFQQWTNTQEVRWRENYRIWMEALKAFGSKGGLITTGDDAGYIYSMYGFGLSRELELHEEAGFHPLDVIAHATANGAELLGLADEIGRVRQGFIADLIVVDGNPLENLRVLYPTGSDPLAGLAGRRDGIEWTIKDGIPYHVPTLLAETRAMVERARHERRPPTAGQ
ncbi:MAG: amidohydrolase family protein [Vicinamibacterales bacterium]